MMAKHFRSNTRFLASLVVLWVTNIITMEVSAWITRLCSSNFLIQRSPSRFKSPRWTTPLPARQRDEFFFNRTENFQMRNESVDALLENATSLPPSTGATGSTAGSFGDIMSPTINDADLLFQDGLVTSETYSLEETYGISNPLDRMAITANGNLQRLFSSYYDAPVVVEMLHCIRQKQPETGTREINGGDTGAIWNRRVTLKIFGNQTFCTADSVVEVHSREVEDLVESGKVGIGQIFRHFNILPEFTLLAAGPSSDGGFWRNYTLETDIVTCSIREVFCKNVWELTPGAIQSVTRGDQSTSSES